MPQLGFMLLEFTDIGPEPLIGDQLPFTDEVAFHSLGQSLGIHLGLIVEQHKENNPVRLYGPLPWKETPNHHLFALAFYGRDPNVTTSSPQGVLSFLVVFTPKNERQLLKAFIALETALLLEFIEKRQEIPLINDETIMILLSQFKTIVWRTLADGEKLIQEEALELVLADPRLLFMRAYYESDRMPAIYVVGEEDEFKEEVDQLRTMHFVEMFLSTFFSDRKIGLVTLPEYDLIVIAIFRNIAEDERGLFTRDDFLEFSKALCIAIPLLREYSSIIYETKMLTEE